MPTTNVSQLCPAGRPRQQGIKPRQGQVDEQFAQGKPQADQRQQR